MTHRPEKELRPDTMRSYRSWCRMFVAWVEANLPGMDIGSIGKAEALQYMDHVWNEKDLTARFEPRLSLKGRWKISLMLFNACNTLEKE